MQCDFVKQMFIEPSGFAKRNPTFFCARPLVHSIYIHVLLINIGDILAVLSNNIDLLCLFDAKAPPIDLAAKR